MWKSIKLQGIKGHLDSKAELSPGLNVFIGDTDAGKSTITRAAYWAVKNPRGYNPAPWSRLGYKGDSIFTIETGEGDVIERIKGRGFNGYKLNGTEFRTASEVPEEVYAALHMDDINLQQQKDFYFLLNETPGEVTRIFNRVANLSIMDEATQAAKTRVADVKRDIADTEEDIKTAEAKIKQLEFADYADQELADLEARQASYEEAQQRLDRVSQGVANLETAQEVFQRCPSAEMSLDMQGIRAQQHEWSGQQTRLQPFLAAVQNYEAEQRTVDGLCPVKTLDEMHAWSVKVQQAVKDNQFRLAELAPIQQRVREIEAAQLAVGKEVPTEMSQTMLDALGNAEQELLSLQKRKEKLQKVQVYVAQADVKLAPAEMFTDMQYLRNRVKSISEHRASVTTVEKLIDRIGTLQRDLDIETEDLAHCQAELQKIRPTSGVCELCGQIIEQGGFWG